jgi:hypothetical protein
MIIFINFRYHYHFEKSYQDSDPNLTKKLTDLDPRLFYPDLRNTDRQCFGAAFSLCGSGSSFLGECGSDPALKMNADPDPVIRCQTKFFPKTNTMLTFNEK